MDVDDEPVDLDMQKKFFDVGPFDRSQVDLNKPATTVEEYLKQVWGAHGRHDKLNIREKN
jgi:hypothetical protein